MKKPAVLLFSLFIAIKTSAFCDIMSDKKLNFSLDIPEGFNVVQADEENYSYHFQHPNIPVQLVLKVQQKENSSSLDVLETNLSKLSAKASYDKVDWEGIICTVSSFTMKVEKNFTGWALCAPLENPENKDSYITLLCYAPDETFEKCQQFIISTLNSLSVSASTAENPGIFLAYAFPKEGSVKSVINIDGEKIWVETDKSVREASEYLVNLEFSVLKLYTNHPMWKEAWQRYYRLVFRDNYGRLSKSSDEIYTTLFAKCKKNRPDDPETEYLTKLLSWVQGFKYERNQADQASDLTPPVLALLGDGNDCDSRSLLLCCIMQKAGIDSIMLISSEFSHALCAFRVNGAGQKYETDYGSYLMCETTARVTPGMIAQEHADRSKWILVD